jgi:HK97 family phage major capsid protein
MLGLTGSYGILPHIDLTTSDSAATVTYPLATAPITLEKIQIGTKSTEGSAQFIGVQLSAYDYRTQPIPVSATLLDAPDADLLGAIVALMVEHIGAALSKRIIAEGTDNKDFAAILKNCTEVTAESNDEITYDDVVNLMAGVKAPFDAVNRAKFVVSSQTRKALLKIRDLNGHPIYVRDMSGAGPATIFGHEVVVDDAMEDIASGAKVMLFGDLKTYKCRLVRGVRVRLYDEQQYADFNCIGVQGFVTGDGRPVRAAGSVEPIAVLKLA